MSQENENLKLRFKLKTGEEFEAQGNLDFISQQKEAFLNLLKAPKPANTLAAYKPQESQNMQKQNYSAQNYQTYKPAYLRRQEFSHESTEQNKTVLKTPSGEVWDKVAYSDGDNIILRRKSKLIKPQIAALIVLGAAKILTEQDTLSALELAKSLKLSGYLKQGQRLDRLLEGEIREGFLAYEGSKRNRLYRISAAGQAKAYTWAEKLLQEY